MRVAFQSGGKDSFYAAYLAGNIDLALVLIYDFPRPSPHLINLNKTIETIFKSLTKRVMILRLRKGHEKEDTITFLKSIGASVIIAGDVYIEEHLKYIQSIADEVGAKLVEPLWGLDSTEVLIKEVNELKLRALFIGCEDRLKDWLGKELNNETLNSFLEYAKRLNIDPLGENGEYHTLLLNSKIHEEPVEYKIISKETYSDENYGEYHILRVI